jgi:biofilm PGA synthesis N-glycosyltransferase PgaC
MQGGAFAMRAPDHATEKQKESIENFQTFKILGMVLFYFIFIILMIAYAVLIAFYHREWNRIPEMELEDVYPEIAINGKAEKDGIKISVIVAMRNESENVSRLLQSLKSQDYPVGLTEIILVDDHSTDNTMELISAYIEPGYIKVMSLPEVAGVATGSFKKQAISAGIDIAAGSLIVTTDADCSFQPKWLSTIAAGYMQTGSVFIAAPVRFRSTNGFLSIFESLDFITLQGITGASVSAKFHTMCNGANLAYTRAAFTEADGFNGIDHIPSGDDMLLMYKIFRNNRGKIAYLKARQAIADTSGAVSIRGFFNQRIRWASKAVHYDDKRIFWILLMVYLVNVSFLIAGITSFMKMNYFLFFLLMLIAKVLIEFPFVNSVAMFFGQQRLMRYFPFMQPFHILYTITAGWLGKFGSYEWKGRKISNHGNRIKGA